MLFIELNNGTRQNLFHISEISIDKQDIVYLPAKSSLNDIREHFETEQEAQQRYTVLKQQLLAK